MKMDRVKRKAEISIDNVVLIKYIYTKLIITRFSGEAGDSLLNHEYKKHRGILNIERVNLLGFASEWVWREIW